MTNTIIHSRSSLETHTRLETKMDNVYTRFSSDQNGAKTLPDGAAHTYIAYIREYPPPPPPLQRKCLKKIKDIKGC